MMLRSAIALLACVCLAGCGKKDPEPSPDPGGDVQVSPGDRLGWTQQASGTSDITAIQFALYVDGVRTPLAGASCRALGAGFDCSALLPSMTAGTHTLELASFVAEGSSTAESARSAPLRVVVATVRAGGTTAGGERIVTTAEEVQLTLAPVAGGLNLPSDLAFAPDGTVFVAERRGIVRVVADGVLVEKPGLDVSADVRLPAGGLLAIALDPQFEDTGFMYALYAAAAPRGGQEFVLARFRYLDGTFAERAVLLDRTPASAVEASGALRVGADGKLYVALDSAADLGVAGSFASYNGKVLRLNTDATTPDDQPAPSPVYSLEHPQPGALDWQPGTGNLWVVDAIGTSGRLSAIPADTKQTRAALRTAYALPAGTGASAAAFYRGDRMPSFTGNLFLAAAGARELMRLRFDPDNALRIVSVERLLKDEIGPVRVVAEGRDGALYIASEDALYRLGPL